MVTNSTITIDGVLYNIDDKGRMIEKPIEEENEMTQETFNKMMDNYLADLATKSADNWSKDAREWAESTGLIKGDGNGNMMYKKFLTREEMVVLLKRLHG